MTIENLTCPKCDGPMVSRANRVTGQRFWGCKDYPTCKGTRDTDGESTAGRGAGSSDGEMPSDRARGNDRQRWRQS